MTQMIITQNEADGMSLAVSVRERCSYRKTEKHLQINLQIKSNSLKEIATLFDLFSIVTEIWLKREYFFCVLQQKLAHSGEFFSFSAQVQLLGLACTVDVSVRGLKKA